MKNIILHQKEYQVQALRIEHCNIRILNFKQEHKHGTSEFDRKMKIPSEYQARPASMQGMEEYIPAAENLIGVPDFSELDGSGKMVKEA